MQAFILITKHHKEPSINQVFIIQKKLMKMIMESLRYGWLFYSMDSILNSNVRMVHPSTPLMFLNM